MIMILEQTQKEDHIFVKGQEDIHCLKTTFLFKLVSENQNISFLENTMFESNANMGKFVISACGFGTSNLNQKMVKEENHVHYQKALKQMKN